MTPPPSTVRSPRRVDLDWIRVGIFTGLIFYHLGLLYAPWSPYYVKSNYHHQGVEVMLLITHPWRMSLLFLISGVATRFLTDKLSAGRMGIERSMRLLPPLAFAFVALIPAQAFLTAIETNAYAGSYPQFLKAFFFSADHTLVSDGRRYVLPVYAHLWFVFYLWSYTVVLAIGLVVAPALFRKGEHWLGRFLAGPWLLLLPLAGLLVLRLAMFPKFGVTLAFFDDWYNHAISLGMFLTGFLVARSEAVWAGMVRMRWPALVIALAGFAVYGAMALHYGGVPEQLESTHPAMSPFYELERWGAIVALLGFGRLHLVHGTPLLTYLNKGTFTFYIVHQPALLLGLHWLKPLGLGPGPEIVLLIAVTLGACWLAYEIARRIGWAAPLLGLGRSTRKLQAMPAAA